MGTKCAPVYATLTFGYLEEKKYTIIETDYDAEFQQKLRAYWKRFLDGCLVPLTKSGEEIITCHSILNNLYSDIKFTLEYDKQEQPF